MNSRHFTCHREFFCLEYWQVRDHPFKLFNIIVIHWFPFIVDTYPILLSVMRVPRSFYDYLLPRLTMEPMSIKSIESQPSQTMRAIRRSRRSSHIDTWLDSLPLPGWRHQHPQDLDHFVEQHTDLLTNNEACNDDGGLKTLGFPEDIGYIGQ